MEKAIITAFMTLGAVVAAALLFAAVYPAVVSGSEAVVSMGDRISGRLKSQIDIIHATADGASALIWVKNVGSQRISAVERLDVFFGLEGEFVRIPYGSDQGNPYWDAVIENDTHWNPTATLKIEVHTGSLLSGRYFIKVTTPNGLSDEYYFSQ
jgi:hypothetical protein